MDFRSLGLFYNFECFLIFSLRNQQGAVCVMRGRPSQGASAVLKGAPLAPLRFLHAHSCLVASSCIEGSGPDQLSSDYCIQWLSQAAPPPLPLPSLGCFAEVC